MPSPYAFEVSTMRRRVAPQLLVWFLLAVLFPVLLRTQTAAGATALPSGFEDTRLTSVNYPTALAFTPDGRLLITTQLGLVRVYESGRLVTDPVLDLRNRVCFDSFLGLLGIAVDPDFATNHFIYLYYTFRKSADCRRFTDQNRVNRVSRFVLPDSNKVDLASEVILIDEMPAAGHSGGDLRFGNDGYLYISTGDAGCDYAGDSGCQAANDAARDEHILLGKILRITRYGTIPGDNPYQGLDSARCNVTGRTDPGKKCQETFAWGLRNPFRMAFDPNVVDTRFFINDVGMNDWEEINLGQAGADYGWNGREGHCATGSVLDCGPAPAGMTNPIYDYSHATGCASITGGAFVPNGFWPMEYDNTYLFSDYVCGKIFKLTPGNGGGYSMTEFVTGLGSASAITMAFGPDNESQALYYATFANGGEVHRISYTADDNRAPIAVATASPVSGAVPLEVTFDATGSSDPEGSLLTYRWDFGDAGAASTSVTATHVYTKAGRYTAVVTVQDVGGKVASAPVRIDVGNTPPMVTIIAPAESLRFRAGQEITLQASATDVQDGPLPDTSLEWSAVLHHNNTHTHPFLQPTSGNNITIIAPEPEDLTTAATDFLEIKLTATDSQGLTSVVTQALRPNLVDMIFETVPTGVQLEVNGSTVNTPQTFVSWEDYALNVVAPPQVDWQGETLPFGRWLDGSLARTRVITTPVSAASYTALFAPATPVLTLSSTNLSWSSQEVNVTSDMQTLTLTNSGMATLNINNISLTGTNPSDFAQSNDCGSSLGAGARCTLSIMFTPTAANRRSATLVITDDAAGSPHSLAVSGFGRRSLLTNGGFELDTTPADGTADNWSVDRRVTRSTTEAHSGGAAIQHTAADDSTSFVHQVVGSLVAGRSYSAGGWVKIPSTPDTFTFHLLVQWRNASNIVVGTNSFGTFTGATVGWEQGTNTLVAPPGTAFAVVLVYASSLNATVYVDDLTFELTDLVVNGGFELDTTPADGTADNWSVDRRVTRSTTEAHSGGAAIRHTAADDSTSFVHQVVGNLVAGRSYSAGGWVKIPSTPDTFTFHLLVQWRNASNIVVGTNSFGTFTGATVGWEQGTNTLVAPPGTAFAVVLVYASSLNATVYVDDLTFRPE